ncbi:MAG: hypothetical protein Q9225_005311 [Loekoesia sp. 1 TL-2023]
MAATTSLRKLPVEVFDRVVHFLADEEPSSTREIWHKPTVHLIDNEQKSLKNLSLTCRSLRTMVFYTLFRFLRLGFDVVLRETSKAEYHLQGLYCMSRFIQEHNLAGKIHGLTLFFPVQSHIGSQYLPDFVRDLVLFALGEVNPRSFTLIGSASLLGSLTSIHVADEDTWAFGERIHVLTLKQPSHLARPGKVLDLEVSCNLLQLRPWTEMTMNEGSCLKVYSVYEYHSKKTPSILNWQGGYPWEQTQPSILPQLRHVSYVSIFPLPSHIRDLARALLCLPQLVSLSTQLTPAADARYDILEDATEVGKANISDVWMEVAQAYTILAVQIYINGGISKLQRWSTPDDKVQFDDIVGSILIDWNLEEPRVWQRICGDFEEETLSSVA